jgi:hypothetical protein
MAAMACEVMAKETLLNVASESGTQLLELMLTKARFPATEMLFNSIPTALIGRSLKDEQPKMFLGLSRLFSLRNALVHKGQQPDPEEVRNCLLAAEVACDWLDTLL